MSQSSLTGEALLERINIGTRKSYYAGRGAKLADVDGEKLIKAYKIIRDEVSPEAAEEFVEMVDAIRELSACNLIDSILRFHNHDWYFSAEVVRPISEYTDMPHGPSGQAFGVVTSTVGGMRQRDETNSIKYYFRQELQALTRKPNNETE